MIKNIIFDLAGVILNLNLERDTQALHFVGLPDFEGCIHNPEIATPMLAYLNGLSTKSDFLRDIRPFCRPDITDSEILWSMDAVLDDIPQERLQRLAELKNKYNVYLLSNIYIDAWEYTLREFSRQGFTTDQCFHRLFLSFEMGLAKPDPAIYHKVIEETGINPSETIYFDDSRSNIEAAKELGFQSVLVRNNQLEEELLSYC